LKPDNVLVVSMSIDSSVCAKLIDFGSSRTFDVAHIGTVTKGIGTPIYMSPEILKGEPYTQKSDVYSFAVTMYELITNKAPYDAPEFVMAWDIANFVTAGSRLPLPADCHPGFAALVTRCWHDDPNSRPNFGTIVSELSALLEENVVPTTSTYYSHHNTPSKASHTHTDPSTNSSTEAATCSTSNNLNINHNNNSTSTHTTVDISTEAERPRKSSIFDKISSIAGTLLRVSAPSSLHNSSSSNNNNNIASSSSNSSNNNNNNNGSDMIYEQNGRPRGNSLFNKIASLAGSIIKHSLNNSDSKSSSDANSNNNNTINNNNNRSDSVAAISEDTGSVSDESPRPPLSLKNSGHSLL